MVFSWGFQCGRQEERKGISANLRKKDMSDFNVFIDDMELIDPPLLDKKFTWFFSDGIYASRLDRFRISEGLIEAWQVRGSKSG